MTIPVISGSSTATWKSLVNTVIGFINGEFAKRPYVWADATARLAQTGMTAGEYGRQTDTLVEYRATGSTTTVPWNSGWISWATPPTNLTVGSGGAAAAVQQYRWITGRLYFDFRFVLGTSGQSVGTGPTLNIPVNIALHIPTNVGEIATGDIYLYDSSPVAINYGKASLITPTTVLLRGYNGSATSAITATVPYTWASGDIIAGGFWADPA